MSRTLLLACLVVVGLTGADPVLAKDKGRHGHGHGNGHRNHLGHDVDRYDGRGPGNPHRQGGSRKEVYWDGPCRVERKWDSHGGYKEKRRCDSVARHGALPPRGVRLTGLPRMIGPQSGYPGTVCNRDQLGTILGEAAAGIVGSPLGQVAGAVIGALLGGAIGQSMGTADQACLGQALEYGQLNQAVGWRNPDGTVYQVTPTRQFRQTGRECRDFLTEAVIDGQRRQVVETACRYADGSWR